MLATGALVTFLGLAVCGTLSGTAGSWIVLIGWISFIFGLHRFGRAST